MSVYYIRAPETGLVKIGFARDPWDRLSNMQTGSPVRLVLAAVEEGGKALEARRHSEFASMRRRGEWFDYTGTLAAHVEALPAIANPVRRSRISGVLGDWIKNNGHTLTSFAELIGSSQAAVSRICDGKQFPRRILMLRIVEVTNGEVDANGLLGIEPQPRNVRQAAA